MLPCLVILEGGGGGGGGGASPSTSPAGAQSFDSSTSASWGPTSSI